MSSSLPAESGAAAAGRVLLVRSSLLAPSETFVLSQALALRRWAPTLVGERRVPGLVIPPALPVLELAEGEPALLRKLRRRICRWAGRAPARDVRRLAPLGARLMHAHFGTDGLDAAPLARALGLPLLVTLHGFDIHVRSAHWQSGAGGAGMRSYPARLRALARDPRVRFIAVSEDVRRAALAFGVDGARVQVLHIGIDVRRFQPGPLPMAERPQRVLFVGRLVEKKGCAHLLAALATPALRALAVEAVIVGEGPLRASLQAQAAALGLRARFLGACSPDQVAHEMGECRLLCLPSVTAADGDAEGFGLVLLEAQASGVPVVTSARGGRDEGLLEGVTGFGVAEGDVAALSGAMARILGDAELAQRMGLAARHFVAERFDIVDCTARLEAHYDQVVEAFG